METKKVIRKQFLQKRRDLSDALRKSYSQIICKNVSEHPFFQSANIVCCYLPFREEVDTTALIELAWKCGKQVLVPKVRSDQYMDFYILHDFQELTSGYQGILEPQRPLEERIIVPDTKYVLMIFPGCTFDRFGNRMGYGKGYYDTYLEPYHRIHKMGLAYSVQCTEQLPVEHHDIRVDVVMTELGDYRKG